MIAGAELDHVAVAAEAVDDLLARYAGDLGGRWWAGGGEVGFTAHQYRWAAGAKLETISPVNIEVDDFLRRFLDKSGPGPHHLTFRVDGLVPAIEQVTAAGYRVVGVQLDVPGVEQCFVHPKDGLGTVIQLIEPRGPFDMATPANWPAPRVPAARLLYVAHAVVSMADGLRLYGDLLGGRPVGRGHEGDQEWIELGWPAGGRLRLVELPVTEAAGRAGRIDHIAFAVDRPAEIAGVEWRPAHGWVLPGAANHGTRLRLAEAG